MGRSYQQLMEYTKEFMQDRFGMFIHWGIYSVAAQGEWLQGREQVPPEEYQTYFEQFNPESFIKRLLGMGDIKGLFEKVQEVVSKESQEKLAKNISKGIFSLRDMRDQYTSVMKMGPLDKVMNMIPGMSNLMPEGSEKEASKKMKKYL